MFNSVALDVVIGLVFIYLLYSLLVTVISELITTALGLRARNLKEAVDRMLNDEKPSKWGKRILDTLNLLKSPKNPVVNAFYDHPEIKYLGSSGVFKTPSYFKAGSFSKTVINLLFGDGEVTPEMINSQIDKLMIIFKNEKNEEKVKEIDNETAKFIRGLWLEAGGDVDEFRKKLELWFERTMEHTIEWYKRKLRVITFILGFLLAWFFNADTFVIAKNLSTDKQAREQMVTMATAYIENNQYSIDTAQIRDAKMQQDLLKRIDSLLAVKQKLAADITKANNILGTGCRLPSQFTLKRDTIVSQNKKEASISLSSVPYIEEKYLSKKYATSIESTIKPLCGDQWSYFFWLVWHHFFGFMVTAVAISLGAPFWFDLLSKVMQLRTGKKVEVASTDNKSSS
jgi:hypothetical protein